MQSPIDDVEFYDSGSQSMLHGRDAVVSALFHAVRDEIDRDMDAMRGRLYAWVDKLELGNHADALLIRSMMKETIRIITGDGWRNVQFDTTRAFRDYKGRLGLSDSVTFQRRKPEEAR